VTRSEALTLALKEERYSRRIWKKDNQGLHQDALHKKRYGRKRKNIKSADKVFRKQTLESLDPFLQLKMICSFPYATQPNRSEKCFLVSAIFIVFCITIILL